MSIPLIGRQQGLPTGVAVELQPDGLIGLRIFQGVLSAAVPLSPNDAKQIAAKILEAVRTVEDARVLRVRDGEVALIG